MPQLISPTMLSTDSPDKAWLTAAGSVVLVPSLWYLFYVFKRREEG